MQSPPTPRDEKLRQRDLDTYAILDSLPEAEYDNITQLASLVCETPISLITLVAQDRQWFMSRYGLDDIQETSRDLSFCAHAINTPSELFEIKDATQDHRFADNPLVEGDPRIAFYAGIPLVSSAGHPLGTICVIDHRPKELTELQKQFLKGLAKQVALLFENRRRQLELERHVAELKTRNSNLDDFATSAAHDLKMPLRQIASLAELLVSDYGNQMAADAQRLLKLINASTRKLHDLVDDILCYSRSKNQDQVRPETVALKELIQGIVQLFYPIPGCKITIPAQLGTAFLDRSSFQQILINLISNAVKYCDKPEILIDIGFEESADYYRFSVTDNGPGIPAELQEFVFDMYIKSGTRDRNGEYGYGIGLATVHNLIERQGGSIRFVSTAGEGTEFRFELPKKSS